MPGPYIKQNNFCKILPARPVVFFPAGSVSNPVPPGRLLPAPVIKGQLCVIVIWVQELKGQSQPATPTLLSTFWDSLCFNYLSGRLWFSIFIGTNHLAIPPSFPISVSNCQFQPKKSKQTFLSSATLSYIFSSISNSRYSCIVLHES